MKKLFAVRIVILTIGFGLIPADRVMAQTFTVLRDLAGPDGADPVAGLILSSNTLYGVAAHGGTNGGGTVFKLNPDGSGFTTIHHFYFSTDGNNPVAELLLSDNTLYGTALNGGVSGNGTVFKVNTDGTGFTNLHGFTATFGSAPFATNSDGAKSKAGLVLSGNRLYGTAQYGGRGNGTVFALNTDGTAFTTVHSFAVGAEQSIYGGYTNNGGIWPNGRLVLSGNSLYGTAIGGGIFARGTVFKINTDGTGFTTLHNFTTTSGSSFTNSDGANPVAGLVLSGNTLYGTAQSGGLFGRGTLFALNTNGSGFATLRTFTGSDAFLVEAALIVGGNRLYGTAQAGGRWGDGVVFALNRDGTGYTNLHSFRFGVAGGLEPYSALVLEGNTLYGTALKGSTVFSLSFAPQLSIRRSDTNAILTWPTNVAGFDHTGFTVQSTTNLSPSVWSPVPQQAVTNAGRISVTVPTSAGSKSFRLIFQ